MADTSKKYLDTDVLNYSIKQLGTKINSTFLQQKNVVPNADGTATEVLSSIKIGDTLYEVEGGTPSQDINATEITEKEIDDILFAVFGD